MFSNNLIKKEDVKIIKSKTRKREKTTKKKELSKKEQINCFAEIIVNHLLKNEAFYEQY